MTLGLAFVAAAKVHSAPPRAEDPDWPCQQRLVPKLTAAAYWSGAVLEGIGDWRADPEIADLVRRLAPAAGLDARGPLRDCRLRAERAD